MILLVMSGSLAYSSFVGTVSTQVSATSDYTAISENIAVCAFWADNTKLYVNNHIFIGNDSCLFNDVDPPSVVVKKVTSYTGSLTDHLNISNLAPGNALLFCINVYNPNSQGCMLSNILLGDFQGTGLSFVNTTLCNNQGGWFSVVNTSLAGNQNIGGYYGIVEEDSNFIPASSYTSVGFFLYLSQCSGNAYMGSSFSFDLVVHLTES